MLRDARLDLYLSDLPGRAPLKEARPVIGGGAFTLVYVAMVVPQQKAKGCWVDLRHLANTFLSAPGSFRLIARSGLLGCLTSVQSKKKF